jgi:large subunit ribosomal protein L10
MNKEQKAAAVEKIAERLGESDAVFAIDYRGISVPQAAELRGKLRDADASFNVVKNRLAKLAAERAGREGLDELLDGPTALTYVRGDVVTAAKAISTFNREHDVLTYKGGFMDGDLLEEDRFRSLARLPALDVMHGQLVGMAASPLTGLARGLGSMLSGLAIALAQVQEQGLVGGDEPAEPAAEEPTAEGEESAAEEPAIEEKASSEEPEDHPDTDADGTDVEADDDSGESGEAAAAGSDVESDSPSDESESEAKEE